MIRNKFRIQFGGWGVVLVTVEFIFCLFVFHLKNVKIKTFQVSLNFLVYGSEILPLLRAETKYLLYSKAAISALGRAQFLFDVYRTYSGRDLNVPT